MFYAAGWGGQNIMVFPELNAVVVTTGGTYTPRVKTFTLLEKYIIPAFNYVMNKLVSHDYLAFSNYLNYYACD